MAKREYSPLENEYRKARKRLSERVRYWSKKGYAFNKKNIIPKSNPTGMGGYAVGAYIDYMRGLTKTELIKRAKSGKEQSTPTEDGTYQILIDIFYAEMEKIMNGGLYAETKAIIDDAISTYGARLFAERLESHASEVIEAINMIATSIPEVIDKGFAQLYAVIREAFADINLDLQELGEYTDYFPEEEYEV